ALGVAARLLPATDDPLRTWLETPAGTFPFQEWFVALGHRDEVDAVHFEGEDAARPAPGVLDALAVAELILLAPSNPYVSIAPILAVRELRDALARRRVPCVAVSPLIGGRAAKGPADRILRRLVEAGDEVVIGSRDAARAQEKANEVGAARGAGNDEAVIGADLVVLASRADAALPTATVLADAIGTTPVLSVASDLRSTDAF